VPDVDIATLSTQVVLAAFALGVAFGAVVHRTNFCTMGSVADVVGFGDWTRMRMWALAVAVATLATAALAALGLINPTGSAYTTPRFTPLAYVVGGLLFGFGMVLAGGCGAKSLVRAGAGSLKALVVAGVLGLVAYISLRGLLAVVRVRAIESVGFQLATPQDLPSLLAGGVPLVWVRLAVAGAIAAGLLVFVLRGRSAMTAASLSDWSSPRRGSCRATWGTSRSIPRRWRRPTCERTPAAWRRCRSSRRWRGRSTTSCSSATRAR
jgi:uncharacterized membrane protein YedE/YeeE